MACCLTTPSHYLNQYCFIFNEILWHSLQSNVYLNTEDQSPICVWGLHVWNHSHVFQGTISSYNDVIMSAIASQITSVAIVYSRRRSKRTSNLRVTALCAGNSLVTGKFPVQRVSNAENVSICWRHHDNVLRANVSRVHNGPQYPM